MNKSHVVLANLLVVCLLTLCACGSQGDTGGAQSGQADASAHGVGDTSTRPADGMPMVYVPGGAFKMGGTGNRADRRHTVELDGFWIDRTEVTNAHYRRCVEAGACRDPTACSWGKPTYADAAKAAHPVLCVSWRDADAYCAWAGGRLPTEAEWEYAARGPDSTLYPWGDEFDGTRLNSCDANCPHEGQRVADYDDGYARTAPAGTYPAGASWCGALDLAGNVWEWVADWHGAYPLAKQTNPTGPDSGTERLIRGGSWFDYNEYGFLRADNRHPFEPRAANDTIGFRCAVPDRTATLPFACTSFAVYSDETFYGMNFDYPDTEIKFSIYPSGDRKVFQMEFYEGDGFSATVGMNSAGLFSSCQMLFPEAPERASPGPDDVYPWQVYRRALFDFESVQEVSGFIADKKVVHWSRTLHDLFADPYGNAMVVEAGEEENVVTTIENDFIVMTNFPNGDFVGQGYETVQGVGADRYKIAYENISEHMVDFDVERGLETLEKAVSSGDFPTQASMVFEPERGQVYIALKKDFGRIWRVSIADQTIETYSGFSQAGKMDLDSGGVMASDLEKASRGNHRGTLILVGGVIVLAGGGCALLVRRRSTQPG
ncbi:MAG: SUMF1/EgtB/PvdO family nonheme iron enzyme [Anaerolineae bacterium]